jgi:hypothetical protein
MNLKKNLTQINQCPICKNDKFSKFGKTNNAHKDLKDLFNLMECKNCKHWFLSKMPKDSFLNNLYKNESQYVFGEHHVSNFKKNLKLINYDPNHWIYKFMKNENNGNYLEVGPGSCTLLNTFKKKGWKCQGYELSKWIKSDDVVHEINKINKYNHEVLVFNDVLEHVADPLSFLKKLSKFQNKGGKLFLSYPNASSFKAKILKTNWSMVAPLAHLNFFSIKSTKILLEECGYHPLIIKQTSFVIFRKLIRSIIRLPITITLDLLHFKILNPFKRVIEIFLNILDLIRGDQMNVVGIKK